MTIAVRIYLMGQLWAPCILLSALCTKGATLRLLGVPFKDPVVTLDGLTTTFSHFTIPHAFVINRANLLIVERGLRIYYILAELDDGSEPELVLNNTAIQYAWNCFRKH